MNKIPRTSSFLNRKTLAVCSFVQEPPLKWPPFNVALSDLTNTIKLGKETTQKIS